MKKQMNNDELIAILFIITGTIILSLTIIRWLNLWYWKIDERIEIEKEQLRVQREILSNLQDLKSEIEEKNNKK
jgi:hypothetical protein